MFSAFNNLRLAARLGVGFGVLALGLVVVAFTALNVTKALTADADDLAQHDLRMLGLVSALGDRTSQSAHLVAQHLYVYDGDVDAQASIEDRVTAIPRAAASTTSATMMMVRRPEAACAADSSACASACSATLARSAAPASETFSARGTTSPV